MSMRALFRAVATAVGGTVLGIAGLGAGVIGESELAPKRPVAADPEYRAPAVVQLDEVGVTLHPMGGGIWRHVSGTGRYGSPMTANGLIVTGGGEALLIDTGWTPAQTGAILRWIETGLRLTPIGVVATHSHADRMGGLEVALEKGLSTYAFTGTVKLARAERLPIPETRFDDALQITVGDRIVELFYPGPGHSPDNIVAWIPDRRLLFGGCLVKSAASKTLGFIGNADLPAWPRSLERVRKRYPMALDIVPGHGEPGGDATIANTLRMIDTMPR